MTDLDRFIKSTMDFDPVAEAEKQLGVQELKGDEVLVAMSNHLDKSKMMERLMQQTNDVRWHMGFEPYCALVVEMGFTLVYEETFQGGTVPELFRVYWNPQGFLLKVESYGYEGGDYSVNSANLYYNVKVAPGKTGDFWRDCVSSGGFVAHQDRGDEFNIWAGYHDVREALRYTMRKLLAHEVLPVWHEAPHLWLVTYQETKTPEAERYVRGYFDSLNRNKIDRFPAELREMLLASIKE